MGEDFIAEEPTNIPSILSSLMAVTDVLIKLNAIDTILSAVNDKIAKELGTTKLKKYLYDKYLGNVDFMRQLKLYSKMTENTETALAYYGNDFLTHSEHDFLPEFEKELAELNKLLNLNIGLLLKEYLKGDAIEF